MKADAVIIGAGPVGLACAIEIQRKGFSTVVVDKGALVNSLVGYPTNMEFFSTPDLIEIGGYPLVSSRYKPIREEAIDYYRRVASSENLNLLLFERVLDLSGDVGTFTITTDMRSIACRFVVVATGFFDQPNLLNVAGEELDKVTHYFKEAFSYTDRDVCIVGAKNSAALAALQCVRRGARVTMVIRGEGIGPTVKYWIRPDVINRINEGKIEAHFNSSISEIRDNEIDLITPEGAVTIANDEVLALTGYHPDYSFLARLGVEIANDGVDTPIYDDDSFETSRPGLYIAGTICGGRHTSRWFIENGRFHAKMIAESLSQRRDLSV